jgi:hypothetical protein
MADQPLPAQPPPAEKIGYAFSFVEKQVDYRTPEWGVVRGKLDTEGTFIPDSLPARKPSILTGGVSGHPTQYIKAINDPRRHPSEIGKPMDEWALKAEFVYEYRSGVLIPGQLLMSGYFVPKVGEKLIPFAEYVPGPEARRIYNLPGEFVPIKK